MDSATELAHGSQVIDPQKNEVRWIDAQAQTRDRHQFEKAAPICRVDRQVPTEVWIVLDRELEAKLLGAFGNRRIAEPRQLEVFVIRFVEHLAVVQHHERDPIARDLGQSLKRAGDVRLAGRRVGDNQVRKATGRGRSETGIADKLHRVRNVVGNVGRLVAVLGAPAYELAIVHLAHDTGWEKANFHGYTLFRGVGIIAD